MKPKTVNELVEELHKLQERGCGEHIVLVSDDEEGNGFHALFGWGIWEDSEGFEYLNEKTNKMETRKTVLIE